MMQWSLTNSFQYLKQELLFLTSTLASYLTQALCFVVFKATVETHLLET